MVGCEPGDALCSEGRRKIFMKEGGCICSDLQDSVMFFTKANFQTPVLTGLWFVPLRRHITDLGTPSGDTVSRWRSLASDFYKWPRTLNAVKCCCFQTMKSRPEERNTAIEKSQWAGLWIQNMTGEVQHREGLGCGSVVAFEWHMWGPGLTPSIRNTTK